MDRRVVQSERDRKRTDVVLAPTNTTHGDMAANYRELTTVELDALIFSLTDDGSNTLPSSDGSITLSSSSSSSPPRPSPITTPRKRPNRQPTMAKQAEELMDCDDAGLPVAVDEDTRKARKMARNRRAAAVSRDRKKQRVDELEDQVAALQQENV